jgi:hypothetical protein
LRGLEKACKESKERLYLTNSSDLIKLFLSFNLIEFYPQLAITTGAGEFNIR